MKKMHVHFSLQVREDEFFIKLIKTINTYFFKECEEAFAHTDMVFSVYIFLIEHCEEIFHEFKRKTSVPVKYLIAPIE